MRITFLGTSSGSPAPNTRCSCTLLEVGDRKYLVDLGTVVLEPLATLNIPLKEINGVFITHMHRDHTDGLPSFYIRLHSGYGQDSDPAIFLPPPMDKTVELLELWRQANDSSFDARRPLRFSEVHEGVIFDDGVLKVTAYPTEHSNVVPTFSYLMEAEGKRIFFSGDFNRWPEKEFHYDLLTPQLDLAVCELGHFPADRYGIIFADHPPKKLCINHISQKRIASAYEFRANAPFPTVLASDGMVLDL